MTTLKNITSKLNLFQYSNIPLEYLQKQVLNGSIFDYSSKVNNDFTLPSKLLEKYEHGLFWECGKRYNNSNVVELYYIEHSRLLFLSPNGNLVRLVKTYNSDKYSFALDYSHYTAINQYSHYIRDKAIKESKIIEPNKIGVFTEKKICNWLTYLDKLATVHKKIIDSSNNRNIEIQNEIQTFIDSINCKVSKYQEITDVTTALFTVRFTHNKKEQYLSKTISFTGSLDDIIKIQK